ncbi:MAG: DNA mismatch endonuclease Vsr [Bacteroidota bacterium]
MADTLSKQRRSEVMAKVRSTNTKPELLVRSFLFSQGFRFRLHDKNLPAKPDIKISKYKCLIFINGCFWHGHKKCKIYVMPKTNKKFWYGKIEANIKRDQKKVRKLKSLGWKVIIIWECDLKPKKREKTFINLLNRILAA